MAVTQHLLDLDAYFKSTEGDKIIINDLNFFSLDDIDVINKSLMTVYDNTETLSSKPSCDCGETQGRYMIGKLCNSCGTICQEPHAKVKPLLWLKAVDPKTKFLNPTVWLMISSLLHTKVDYLRYFCDTRYNPPVKMPPRIVGIKQNVLNNVRTYENTMANLENILIYCLNNQHYKDVDKQAEIRMMLELIKDRRDIMFSNYLPIINKKLFVVENTTKGKFINLASADIVDVIKTWLKLCSEDKITEKQLSNTMGSVLSNLAKLYNTYFDQYIVKKYGTFRKHVYGARSHFTFRCVIVSKVGKHVYDEITVPWCVGTTAFRPHIINKLVKRGYTYKQTINKLYKAVKKFDPEIYEILNELIKESPHKGIAVLCQRNPSLKQGSSQLCYITEFGTNTLDMTFKISSLIIKAPNGDYDGDELNVSILLDNFMEREFKTLKPYFNVPETSKPYAISGNLTLLSPSTSILSNFLYDKSESTRKDQICNGFKFVEM